MQCAPTIRAGRQGEEARHKRETSDWHRYAERTVPYAFGVAGDVILSRNEKYFEHWRNIEGIEPEKQETPRFRMR